MEGVNQILLRLSRKLSKPTVKCYDCGMISDKSICEIVRRAASNMPTTTSCK